MKLIRLTFLFVCLFCIQFVVRAEKILIEEGDIVQYPLDAKPDEVIATMNGLRYVCTVTPGDYFKIFSIYHNQERELKVAIIKIDGSPGDQKVCHVNSLFMVWGTYEITKTKENLPKKIKTIFSPFIFVWNNLERIQKKFEMEDLSVTDTDKILLKEEGILQYPLDAEPIEVTVIANHVSYNCTVAPGDYFQIIDVSYLDDGRAVIMLYKTKGKPGGQNICPMRSVMYIRTDKKCALKRTEEGIPEGINCRISVQTFFGLPSFLFPEIR